MGESKENSKHKALKNGKKKIVCGIGILTAGGDCPGLNAAIRAVAKSSLYAGRPVIGFLDGFRGLVENRYVSMDEHMVSGIITLGGTILGTSRDKPHKMSMGGRIMDMTDVAAANFQRLNLECLVCLGGNGTQKNAYRLARSGINVITLPKTIDNDVVMTDTCFGYDTAKGIATEAIDRLHTTASSHHRIIAVEVMGHSAGWLALGAGIAGGADVILIPEIPYDISVIADFLNTRRQEGKRFSIITVAEGAISKKEFKDKIEKNKPDGKNIKTRESDDGDANSYQVHESRSSKIVRELQRLTGMEARMTELGHVQRGGTPTPADRLLCTRLGAAVGELLNDHKYNVMVAVKGEECVPVPLESVAGKVRSVPIDHPWIRAARMMETCMGD